MSAPGTAKRYDPNTQEWVPVFVGARGISGIHKSDTPPDDTGVLWLDTEEVADYPLPSGGEEGEVLAKASGATDDVEWQPRATMQEVEDYAVRLMDRKVLTDGPRDFSGTTADILGSIITVPTVAGRRYVVRGFTSLRQHPNETSDAISAQLSVRNAAGDFLSVAGANSITATGNSRVPTVHVAHPFVGDGSTIAFRLGLSGGSAEPVREVASDERPTVIEVYDEGVA